MDLHRKLRTISAITFHEIKFTGVIFLLDKDYNEDKKYKPSEVIEIHEAWMVLYDEYYEKTDDPKLRRELKNKKKSLKLLININILGIIIDLLELIEENDEYVPNEAKLNTLYSLKKSINKVNRYIIFNPLDDVKTSIKSVKGFLSGLETRYKLYFKEDLKVSDDDLLLFYTIKSSIEQILNKDNIPDHINMLQWIAYEKDAKRKLKNGKQHNKRVRGN